MSRACSRPKIVVLGMMSRIPVPGVVWQTAHYLVGLERLGFEVYYVEDHGMTPRWFFQAPEDDGWSRAAAFVDATMRRFGLTGRWAVRSEFAGTRHFGMSARELDRLYRDAALLLNLHGSTLPREEHAGRGRLALVETDPVELQVKLASGDPAAIDYAAAHCAHFTFGESYGLEGCGVPTNDRFCFLPTRQPVVLDWWEPAGPARPRTFTTIGNWRQPHRQVTVDGATYQWSKDLEFRKILGVPERTGVRFELALGSCLDEDRALLADHGWHVRPPFLSFEELDGYRAYVAGSQAELTVAKEQNTLLRSGWFSDRSATYLASGRPVITQDTGFGRHLPTGKGLLAFSTEDEAVAAVEEVLANPRLHEQEAREIATEFFAADRVLGDLLDRVGMTPVGSRATRGTSPRLPATLDLSVQGRWPTTILQTTLEVADRLVEARLAEAADRPPAPPPAQPPAVSIVVVAYETVEITALCLESVLAAAGRTSFEVVVVDNGSTDRTPAFAAALARCDGRVRLVRLAANTGFAGGNNAGLAVATGQIVVLLNSDTIVADGWLDRLVAHLDDPGVGLVGPVTNHACNEAQIQTSYRTLAEMTRLDHERAGAFAGQHRPMDMLAMFCVAARRAVLDEVGPLDETFGVGMFEDDDYSARVRAAGYDLRCAEDVFVHHFGEVSLGRVVSGDRYLDLFAANRKHFETKWERSWAPHGRRVDAAYEELRDRAVEEADALLPQGAPVLVVSKGDERFVAFPSGRSAGHFPGRPDGTFLGEYPADSAGAIDLLAGQRSAGAAYLVVPDSGAWWLQHYAGLHDHLQHELGGLVHRSEGGTIWDLRSKAAPGEVDAQAPCGAAEREQSLEPAPDPTAALRRCLASQADEMARLRQEIDALRALVLGGAPVSPPAPHGAAAPDGPAGLWRDAWAGVAAMAEELGASNRARYLLLRSRLRAALCDLTPPGAVVAVVSRGDDALLDLPDRRGWHFPRMADGQWAGAAPADDEDAIRRLDLLGAVGADHLVIPATYSWWIGHYPGLVDHLAAYGAALDLPPELGWAWRLHPAAERTQDGTMPVRDLVAAARARLGHDPTVLDWATSLDLVHALPALAVFSPPFDDDRLPYLPHTVDVVVVGAGMDHRLDEARRVAGTAVAVQRTGAGLPGLATARVDVRWCPAAPGVDRRLKLIAWPSRDGHGLKSDGRPRSSVAAQARASVDEVVAIASTGTAVLRGWEEAVWDALADDRVAAVAGSFEPGWGPVGRRGGPGVALLAVRRSSLPALLSLLARLDVDDGPEALAELDRRLRDEGLVVATTATAVAVAVPVPTLELA